jgi:hypothetical protein
MLRVFDELVKPKALAACFKAFKVAICIDSRRPEGEVE